MKPWWRCNGGYLELTMDAAAPPAMKFVMPSDPRYLPVVRGAIGPWPRRSAGTNPTAARSRWRSTKPRQYHPARLPQPLRWPIELECRESADGLEIYCWTSGDAPDRTKICAREIGCDQPGGLGTHIIKDVMDTVSYQASPEGNRFVATKRLRKTI
jgi:hypothetical protein